MLFRVGAKVVMALFSDRKDTEEKCERGREIIIRL